MTTNPPGSRPGVQIPSSYARTLRMLYAGMGILIAITWVSNKNEPVWEHALRTLLILLTIPVLMGFARRRARRDRANPTPPSRARSIVARTGLIAAAFVLSWLIGYLIDPSTASVTSLLVRLALIVTTIPLQVRAARRPSAGKASAGMMMISTPRLISAKLILLGAALAAEWGLQHVFDHADLVIAAALAITVALVGPRVHPYLLNRRARDTLRAVRGRQVQTAPGTRQGR